MTFEEFQTLAQQGNVVPVYEKYLADLLTPVSAFMRLEQQSHQAFLLESVEGGEKTARFSFLGCDPYVTLTANNGEVSRLQNGDVTRRTGSIFDIMKRSFGAYRAVRPKGLPRFTGGAVGYFGYETIRHIEDVPTYSGGQDGAPESVVMLFDKVLAFDHLTHQIFIIQNVFVDETQGSLREEYDAAIDQIRLVRQALESPIRTTKLQNVRDTSVVANFSESHFCDIVRQAKEYISRGDIFQVVLSQRFEKEVQVSALDIYRALRIINPSPYLYFLKMRDRAIIGSSPELLVRVDNRTVEVRPIAGTRRRGRNEGEDKALAAELRHDEKEVAEHVMLVDLGRNDVGRVSEFGSVEVTDFMTVEKYSHVMHLVSNVRGKLRDGLTAIDALQACFPAGTVSGAPKIRAMGIIHELEAEPRGIYSGALGYLDFSGNLDTCIAIRTLVMAGNKVSFQAGAGIVSDSVPEREYRETLDKAAALRDAIAFAERGLR